MPLSPAMIVVGIRSPGINRPTITALRPRRANHCFHLSQASLVQEHILAIFGEEWASSTLHQRKEHRRAEKDGQARDPNDRQRVPNRMWCLGSRQHHQGVTGYRNGNAGFLDQDREKECGQFVRIEEAKQQVSQCLEKMKRGMPPLIG